MQKSQDPDVESLKTNLTEGQPKRQLKGNLELGSNRWLFGRKRSQSTHTSPSPPHGRLLLSLTKPPAALSSFHGSLPCVGFLSTSLLLQSFCAKCHLLLHPPWL
ncbi:unnamed protein product [Rhodiola kirilowii]